MTGPWALLVWSKTAKQLNHAMVNHTRTRTPEAVLGGRKALGRCSVGVVVRRDSSLVRPLGHGLGLLVTWLGRGVCGMGRGVAGWYGRMWHVEGNDQPWGVHSAQTQVCPVQNWWKKRTCWNAELVTVRDAERMQDTQSFGRQTRGFLFHHRDHPCWAQSPGGRSQTELQRVSDWRMPFQT